MSTWKETSITGCNYENTSISTIDIKRNVSKMKYIIHKNQLLRNKKIKIYKLSTKNNSSNLRKEFCLICRKLTSKIKETSSTPNLNDIKNEYNIRSGSKSSNEISSPFKYHITVNIMKSTKYPYNSRNLHFKRNWKIYRCQFNTQEESCCCSCNSDAMFEVMKSLYDCYKKKNCDHCNCILCGHLPREERRLGELRKSELAIKEVSVAEKMKEKIKAKSKKNSKKFKAEELIPKKGIPSAKLHKAKAEGLLTPLEGKTPEQKAKILRGLAMNGIPLPPSTTASEKNLIDKVRKDLGLPPEPLTPAEKKKYKKAIESGLITPLEGKLSSEKEKILRGLVDLGVPLPEGRTPSEQSLIKNIREKARAPSIEKTKVEAIVSKKRIPSAKLRKAKAEGLLTPLEGKTSEQKEKILRGLAMNGIPLPPSKTASEKNLIDKVRKDLGLPPEPLNSAERKKYNKAMESGLITPLEGKSASYKEKILQGLADLGVPLPEGRTPSEQSLIKNIREKARTLSIEKAKAEAIVSKKRIPSAKLRKAKAEGLLTPLEGKSPEQKEKILRGLAMNGIPLPPGKTTSERKLIDKVRKDLGLPPEPLTPAEKKKYSKAMESGLTTPLEGKSSSDKEKILRGLADLGVPLPEGRTPSEQILIKNIREKARAPSIEKTKVAAIVSKKRIPSAKLRKAKAEGLLTPLEGKTPEQKEKILRGLAMNGIPLPPSKTASERKLIDKVRRDLGLPSEPVTSSEKNKYNKAMESGLITPLEGKSSSEKERILKGLHDMGIPLTEGRTRSEKDLIKKIKTGKVKRSKSQEKSIGTPALPLEERKKLDEKTLKVMKEGKGPSDECICGLLTPHLERVSKVSKIFPPSKFTSSQKEKMLIKQAEMGVPLPEGRTPSEKELIEKIRASVKPGEVTPRKKVSLPSPLEGKTPEEREKILRNLVKAGLQLPEGKTPSEKQVVKKVKQEMGIVSEASEKLRKAKAAGLLTPLEGKTPAQKEEILKRYIDAGLPLPEAKTPSEKKIIKDLIAKSSKQLRGKTPSQKEKILRSIAKQGLPLPEPKTASEKVITEKLQRELGISPEILTPSKKLKRAQAAGLLTPLTGKKPEEKERILRDLAKAGIPLPEAKTASEQKIIDKVRQDLGLPPEPKTPSLREEMKRAQAAGIITPLEGKTPSEKEKVLRKMHEARIPLPKGRTKSEKSLIKKIEAEDVSVVPSKVKKPSEKLREAKAKGIVTPLEGKSIAHKEKILRGLAKSGLPLPEGKTPSEKALIAKIQAEEGIIPSRPTPLPEKYIKLDKKTAKVMKEGKGPSDECICDLLTPESEKEKIRLPVLKKPSRKIPSEKIPKLEGKSPKEKEKILKDLAMQKLPLPEPKTVSERKLFDKVREELGLPPHPKSPSAKETYKKAMAAGLITPLQGKSASQKEKILRGQAELGIPLPEGRTPSEKALIAKIKATAPKPTVEHIPSEKMQKLKAAGLLTPLTGKTPEQKEKILKGLAMHGVPLPEPKTASERKLTDKVRAELGLPPPPKTPSAKENYNKAIAAGLITPLQGKSVAQKEKILRGQAELGLPLPEGRTPSEQALIGKIKAAAPKPALERIPSEKMQKLKAAGLLTPLTGKTPEQKEKILKGLAMHGVPLPEPKTASERKLTDKVRAEFGLPPHPKTPSAKENYNKAMAAGLITPLQGKSASQKERILKGQAELGIPLPEGRTPSEKVLIQKIKAAAPRPVEERIPSEKLQKLKAAGLLTPLTGKTPEQKEKIFKGLAMNGVPLPEPKTASERKLNDKVRSELGLPPHPKTPSAKENYNKAMAAGLITPLQGKSASQKERILKGQAELGIPLPEGRTPSEKAIIEKIKATAPRPVEERIPSEKLQKLKTAGLLTPLTGKTPEQKEKILKGLAMNGVPLPEPKTASERKLIDKVRAELGLPPEPKTSSEKLKYKKALAAGLITPLQGKSVPQKEKILRGQAEMGLSLPEGRTPSEKALIQKIKETGPPKIKREPSEKLRKSKVDEILATLKGKTPKQKEEILKDLAQKGIPLPEGRTASEKKIINKIRAEVGLPPVSQTPSKKEKYVKALPLPGKLAELDKKTAKIMKEGKGPSDECICKLLTPEFEKIAPPKRKTPSKVIPELYKIPSKKLRKVRTAGLLTPLQGKSKEEKEKILKGLAMNGIPLPEGKTASEKKLIDRIRNEIGLPPEPKSPSMKEKYNQAIADDIIIPLEGKTNAEKEKILKRQAELGLPLPVGRTPSEKAIIAKIKAAAPKPAAERIPSEKLRKAQAAGLLTPLEGKTPEKKEKILKGLIEAGMPLPEGKTPSEKALIHKVLTQAGVSPEIMPATKKSKIKTKSKKIGAVEARRSVRRVGVSKSKGGIVEEFQDIIKTTTCDRGCGCDKKKIRFKHSYVKIRVTSPDISSLCPCPEECVPRVKGGVFTDNEGIKVTVGRVTGVASFSSRKSFLYKSNYKIYKTASNHICKNTHILKNIINNGSDVSLSLLGTNINYSNETHNTKSETEIYSHMRKTNHSFHGSYFNCFPYDCTSNNSSIEEADLIKSRENNDFSNSLHHIYIHTSSRENSTASIYLLNTISSVSLVTLPDTVSVWSISATSTSATCASNLYDSKILEDLFLQSAFGSFSDISIDVYGCSSENSSGFNEIPNYVENNLNPEVQVYIANESKTINTEKSKEEGPIAIVESFDSADSILKLLYRQLSQNEMYNTSSFIVIMSSSSDNCSSILPVNNCSSTICLELSENQSIWNTRSSCLHHIQQKQKGFKIAALKNFNNQKKCTDTCKSRMISMDTTEDRPCCCLTKAKKSKNECNKAKKGKVDNILSEFVTPIIHKEVVARGLSSESYNVWNCPKDTTRPSYISFSHSQLCKVTPCRGSTGCHYKNKPKYNADVAPNRVIQDNVSKPCHCNPPKFKGMLAKNSNHLISKSCGVSTEALCENRVTLNQRTVQVPYEVTNRTTKMSCDGCDLTKLNLSDKKTKRACPCGEPKDLDVSTKSHTEESMQYKDQKRVKKYKNVVCECPEEPEPELIDFEIDEKQMRKIKSDLTQTLSGFKIDVLKKTSDSEMSFEEALRYFAENLEEDQNTKKNTGCECPFEPLPPQVEPFIGIKFHIDGKGTATKGLSGILCFE